MAPKTTSGSALGRWLDEQKISRHEFARRIGVAAPVISRLAHGTRKTCSATTARAIAAGTGGAIRFEDLLYFEPAKAVATTTGTKKKGARK